MKTMMIKCIASLSFVVASTTSAFVVAPQNLAYQKSGTVVASKSSLRATPADAIAQLDASQQNSVNAIAAAIPDLAPKSDLSWTPQNGVTVVSGLARGVDGIAHQAALNAGGRTFAVLGSGVDRVYPPEHRNLAEAIIGSGAILSDYPPDTLPEASNFPPRNRIISGLSMATIVIEAAETSGALITADFAVEQGREVFAVPGNIFAPQSKGPNRLIQNGAHPLLKPHDILDVLDLTRVTEQSSARKTLPSDATEAQLLDALNYEPLHVDEIRAKTGLAVEKVSSTLVMMELKGMVRHVGGMNYVVARETQADYDA